MVGSYQTSRIGTGNNFSSRMNTENDVVRTESMTLAGLARPDRIGGVRQGRCAPGHRDVLDRAGGQGAGRRPDAVRARPERAGRAVQRRGSGPHRRAERRRAGDAAGGRRGVGGAGAAASAHGGRARLDGTGDGRRSRDRCRYAFDAPLLQRVRHRSGAGRPLLQPVRRAARLLDSTETGSTVRAPSRRRHPRRRAAPTGRVRSASRAFRRASRGPAGSASRPPARTPSPRRCSPSARGRRTPRRSAPCRPSPGRRARAP